MSERSLAMTMTCLVMHLTFAPVRLAHQVRSRPRLMSARPASTDVQRPNPPQTPYFANGPIEPVRVQTAADDTRSRLEAHHVIDDTVLAEAHDLRSGAASPRPSAAEMNSIRGSTKSHRNAAQVSLPRLPHENAESLLYHILARGHRRDVATSTAEGSRSASGTVRRVAFAYEPVPSAALHRTFHDIGPPQREVCGEHGCVPGREGENGHRSSTRRGQRGGAPHARGREAVLRVDRRSRRA